MCPPSGSRFMMYVTDSIWKLTSFSGQDHLEAMLTYPAGIQPLSPPEMDVKMEVSNIITELL